MKNVRLIAVVIVVSLVVLTGGLFQDAAAQWKPEKPINLIVPWGAGGSTDRSARTNAGIIEESLGQKIVVVNQPGASGSVWNKELS